MIKRMNNREPDFYKYLGPVFGSRKIQRSTKDRFYDDNGKEWILNINDTEDILAVLSVSDDEIKNVYADDNHALAELLKTVYPFIRSGIVPSIYREQYQESGFLVLEHSTNYVNIKGGKTDEH